MGGLLVASIGSGQVVSRWGRYKVFPMIGTALMTIGLYLMSLIGVTTGAWTIAGYMVVFGLGLGLVMQVLVVAVQNAVPYEELGTATSGATFFRMIGGSLRHGGVRRRLRQPGGPQRPACAAPEQGAGRLQPQRRQPVGHPPAPPGRTRPG